LKKITFKTLALICITLGISTFASSKEKAHWDYKGAQGPEKWGSLNHEWQACADGSKQSPIDLKWKKPKSDRTISFHYKSSPFKVLDNGHTVQANFMEGNYVKIKGQRFDLLQLHFHAHSEHSIGKKFYPLEMHLVHKNAEGKLAVVGVMFQEGAENHELEKIFAHVPSKQNHEKAVETNLDFNGLVPSVKTHYHYMGSLTTPPCSEGVNWNVFNTAVSASAKQLAAFKKMYSANYRPIQNLNGRLPANY